MTDTPRTDALADRMASEPELEALARTLERDLAAAVVWEREYRIEHGRVERLTEQLIDLKRELSALTRKHQELELERDAILGDYADAKTRLSAAQRDAERYRYARMDSFQSVAIVDRNLNVLVDDGADAAIDAAIKESGNG